MIFIYRQEIIHDIHLFTSQPKSKFYNNLFLHLDVTPIINSAAKTGRKSQRVALFCAFIVMKCEGFSQASDLHDYLTNNLLIAYYCGFDITEPLPSCSTFRRFIRRIDNQILKEVMQSQVLKLAELGIIDASFIGLDSTAISANTHLNNPKSFAAQAYLDVARRIKGEEVEFMNLYESRNPVVKFAKALIISLLEKIKNKEAK